MKKSPKSCVTSRIKTLTHEEGRLTRRPSSLFAAYTDSVAWFLTVIYHNADSPCRSISLKWHSTTYEELPAQQIRILTLQNVRNPLFFDPLAVTFNQLLYSILMLNVIKTRKERQELFQIFNPR